MVDRNKRIPSGLLGAVLALLCLRNKNVAIVPVHVDNAGIQNSDSMTILHRKLRWRHIARMVVSVYEFLERSCLPDHVNRPIVLSRIAKRRVHHVNVRRARDVREVVVIQQIGCHFTARSQS